MRDYLVFTLSAPMASFGTVAVGERRPTWDRPGKSQVIGLAASALGIERTEEERQQELAASLAFAVRVDDPGRLASDYHTAEAPKEVSIRRREKAAGPIRTRRDELLCDDRKTILSMREFRTGTLHTIALWKADKGEYGLSEIAAALAAPAFVPFAGRKAHPLMLPMAPRIVSAASVSDAFNAYDKSEPDKVRDLRRRYGLVSSLAASPIYADRVAESTDPIQRIEERRDTPLSRAKWRFELRSEVVLKSETGGNSV